MALSSIELFAGVGMLGEGVRAGLGYLGIKHRSICFVEREAYAAAVLVARMQEGSLDEAPVWADVTTFDAAAWRGKVDCVIAGFPCQDLSVAGKRAGLDGKRSGLFFEVTRIAADCGAWLLILENVGGIASATASVMDEAEGQLEERAAARVLGELADLGWDAEWLHLSASAVGASHGRERWFCFAWRMADTDRGEPSADRRRSDTGTDRRNDATGCRAILDDAHGAERRQGGIGGTGGEQGHDGGRRQADRGVGVAVTALGDTEDHHGRRELEPGSTQCGRPGPSGADSELADAGSPRHEGREQRGALHGDRGGASTWTS